MEIDPSLPDRHVGSMLSGEEVERLRQAIGWLRENRGLRLKDLALGCDSAEHTIRNFAYRKSNRPDNTFLGKLYKYLAGNKDLLPAEHLTADAHGPDAPDSSFRAFSRFDLIKMDLPIAEGDLKRVFDRYSGYYLFFRRSYRPGRMSVSWLHLRPLSPKMDLSKGGLPLPRFTLFTKYPNRIDPNAPRSYIVPGYAITKNSRLYFVGHHDGELKFFTLTEPPSARFTYMQGICLFSSADDNQPFATRLVCQRLGPDVDRDDWEDKIGVFPVEKFDKAFDNADIVTRALGDGGVLFESDPDRG